MYYSFFLNLELKQRIHSYTTIVPSKAIPKMGKMYTRFQTKTVQRLYPLGRHIPTMAYIWGYPGHFKPDLPCSQGSLSGTGRRENPGNEVGPCILAPSCKKTMQLIKKRFFILVKSCYILVFSYFFSLPINRFRCPNTVYAISEFQKLSKRTSVQKLPC